jgi:hypothetical protein
MIVLVEKLLSIDYVEVILSSELFLIIQHVIEEEMKITQLQFELKCHVQMQDMPLLIG